MALVDKKVLESERNQVYVKSTQGTRLTGTVEQNKDVFDKFPQLIMQKYNELIDLLTSLQLDNIVTDLSNRYTKSETDELVEAETEDLVANVEININTGVITITKKDGTYTTIDTAIEKVPATFEFIQDTQNDKYYLKVTNVDGTSSQTEVTNLMNQYTFQNGDIVTFSISKNGTTTTVTASIKGNSITFSQLSTEVKNYWDEIAAQVESDKATVAADKLIVVDASQTVTQNTQIVLQAKSDATEQATLAKSYAVGGTSSREGEDIDNAKYYKEQAEAAKEAAEAAAEEAEQVAGGDFVTNATFQSHAGDTTIHVSSGEKSIWNGKASKISETVILSTTWTENKTQTVQIEGLLATDDVIVSPDPTSYTDYTECVVRATSQSDGNLVFTCNEVPTEALTVNVLIVR